MPKRSRRGYPKDDRARGQSLGSGSGVAPFIYLFVAVLVIAAIIIFVVAAAIAGVAAAGIARVMGDTPTGKIAATVLPAIVMVIARFMILEQLNIAPQIVEIAFAATMFGHVDPDTATGYFYRA